MKGVEWPPKSAKREGKGVNLLHLGFAGLLCLSLSGCYSAMRGEGFGAEADISSGAVNSKYGIVDSEGNPIPDDKVDWDDPQLIYQIAIKLMIPRAQVLEMMEQNHGLRLFRGAWYLWDGEKWVLWRRGMKIPGIVRRGAVND